MIQNKIKKILILGAGGRDFHNFNVCFRDNPNYKVIGFTAAQIPNIENRIYPPELAGRLYPNGIPIFPEKELTTLIKKYEIDEAIFAYSDVSHQEVMHQASQVLASGADFKLIGPKQTMLESKLPVIAVCAVRTGCGKSPLTRKIAKILRDEKKKAAVVRHPMPYGYLKEQTVQRFENFKDLNKHSCTIEEREEHEPLIELGFTVFAGVDYEKILKEAEKTAEIIIWDGGNNDFPFIKPNLLFVVVDPLRIGHEINYHPGEVNFRMADVIVINRKQIKNKKAFEQIYKNAKALNPAAKILEMESQIFADRPELIKNKKVLIIEDGPTMTHGGMPYGAGMITAEKFKAKKVIEPYRWAAGTIKETFKKYPHVKKVLPAMGYSKKQIKDLEMTIKATPCDTVIVATPIDLSRIVKIEKPTVRVSYELEEIGRGSLINILREAKCLTSGVKQGLL